MYQQLCLVPVNESVVILNLVYISKIRPRHSGQVWQLKERYRSESAENR